MKIIAHRELVRPLLREGRSVGHEHYIVCKITKMQAGTRKAQVERNPGVMYKNHFERKSRVRLSL